MTGLLTTALAGFFVATTVAATPAGILATSSPFAGVPTNPLQELATQPDDVPLSGTTLTVSMTGYNAVAAQTDADPMTTASGARSNPDIVAARSVDLATELPYGTVIQILPSGRGSACGLSLVADDIGLRVIADSMHSRKRNQIDVMLDEGAPIRVAGKDINPAIALGVCTEVRVRVVGKIDIDTMPRTQRELARMLTGRDIALAR